MTLKAIRTFFDEHAAGWDAAVPAECTARAAELMDSLAVPVGARVLDVGAGAGVLFPLLAPRLGAGGLLVAIDVSERMLAEAKAKGIPACLVLADAASLPFATGSFDLVVCYSVFPHFEDQSAALLELARALRPGGELAICHSRSRADINAFHEQVGHVVGGHVIPENDAMRGLIRDAGFRLLTLADESDRYMLRARRA